MDMKVHPFKLVTALLGAALCLSSCLRTDETEILIIGGGASGISAGIQASRMGVPVIIVEETPWVGGMLTCAGVSCIDGNYRMRSGIFGEFTDSLASRYGGWEALKTGWVSRINFEPHVGQEVLTNMAAGCGDNLEIRRETRMLKVYRKGEKWVAIFKPEDGGKYRIAADVLIDGTELGDIAKECGVEYRIGMEASSDTGESIAPDKANDVIQDLTYVAILKDYGADADMTLDKPEGYDPEMFANCAKNARSTVAETGQTIWDPQMMITYGRTPNGKYMINWPTYGNDYYVNSIEMSRKERKAAYAKAKEITKSFIYFIQTELGMKNLGIADDEFPTGDGLALFPYHRESRRIVGKAFFTIDAAAEPYAFNYYRTGIAVGDYPVDHHHFRHPDWKSLPDLHFYPIPSFNVPLGVLIPKQDDINNLIVAEKSISVSNLMNGATRLQPVVMQLGQASGALAALACIRNTSVDKISIRKVQETLLEAGCYIMPYLDLPPQHMHFKTLQRIGSSGILRGEGRNVGWSNETWFRINDPLLSEEIFTEGYYDAPLGLPEGPVTIASFFSVVRGLGIPVPSSEAEDWWNSLGLKGFDLERIITRLEAAVLIDTLFNPFAIAQVDYQGNINEADYF